MEITEVRAHDDDNTALLCFEIGDHVALASGGGGARLILGTTDGKTFHSRPTPRSNGLRGMRMLGDELWIVGEYGTCAVSRDRGASWEKIKLSTGECLWDIIRDDKGVLWIGGSGSTVLRSKNGRVFKEVEVQMKPRDERADPRIERVGVGLFFAVFNAYWDGAQFVKARGVKGAMSALATSPAGTVVLVGDRGAAFRSTDGGASFEPLDLNTELHFNDIAYVADGFIAVGDKGVMRRSVDDGVTWKPMKSGTKHQLWSIGSWGTGAFAGGDGGIVLRIAAPDDRYWDNTVDEFAPRPVVAVKFTPTAGPTQEQRDARHATRFAAALAKHAELAAALPPPRVESDCDHDRAILAAIDDVNEYLVYADVLQGRHDPRGELIVLQHSAPATKPALIHLLKHRAMMFGKLAEVNDLVSLVWRWGFIHGARVANTYDREHGDKQKIELADAIGILLSEPSARFLRELTVGIVTTEDNSYASVIRELGKRALPSLGTLFLGDFDDNDTEISWSKIGDLTPLYPAVPNLEQLTLKSGSMKFGAIVLPRLRELSVITGGFTRRGLKALLEGELPSLEKLSLHMGTDEYGCDIAEKHIERLLHTDRFPKLVHLGLCNSEIADDVCKLLHHSTLLPQLTELDLSRGTLGDEGARAIATYAGAYRQLKRLDVSESYLTDSGMRALEQALPNTEIIANDMRDADDDDDRYVTVGE